MSGRIPGYSGEGSWLGEAYITPYTGNSVGLALIHGWLAGKIISKA